MFKKAQRLAPAYSAISMNLGIAYYKTRNVRSGNRTAYLRAEREPSNLQARYLKGMCHFLMDDYPAAVREPELIARQENKELENLLVFEIAYGNSGRLSELAPKRTSGVQPASGMSMK